MAVVSFLALPLKLHIHREQASYMSVIRYPSQYLHEIVTPLKYIAEFAEFLCSHSRGYFNETKKLRNHYGKTPASDKTKGAGKTSDIMDTESLNLQARNTNKAQCFALFLIINAFKLLLST